MSTPQTPSYQQRPAYPIALLGSVALLCSTALVIADLQTRDAIEQARERELGAQLAAVTPARDAEQAPLEHERTVRFNDQRHRTWQLQHDGEVIAVAVESEAKGYGGPIRVLVGIDPEGTIQAARVLEHRETPGLGDDIEAERSDWIDAFEGRSLTNPPEDDWAVKRDNGAFDQLTGATITPRAVVEAVHQALKAFEAHQEVLLDPMPPTESASRPPTDSDRQTSRGDSRYGG